MSDTFNRAKINILSNIVQFPTINGKDWSSNNCPPVGSLVSLSSAPPSQWYLSWVEEVQPGTNEFCSRYLLRSIETGELCWWSNVTIFVYNPERVYDRWRWSDKQFKFYDRWQKVLRRADAWMVLDGPTTFGDDGSVTIRLRERHGGFRDHDQFHFERSFPDWRKVTMAVMADFYNEGCKAAEALGEKIKAQRKAAS